MVTASRPLTRRVLDIRLAIRAAGITSDGRFDAGALRTINSAMFVPVVARGIFGLAPHSYALTAIPNCRSAAPRGGSNEGGRVMENDTQQSCSSMMIRSPISMREFGLLGVEEVVASCCQSSGLSEPGRLRATVMEKGVGGDVGERWKKRVSTSTVPSIVSGLKNDHEMSRSVGNSDVSI